MVVTAPRLAGVLPALTEFVGGAVLVGHDLRFDVSFLDAALAAFGRDGIGVHRVGTVMLARRLLDDEVPDHRLGTLSTHLGLAHQPTHRSLDDALATPTCCTSSSRGRRPGTYVWAWLQATAGRARPLQVEGVLACDLPGLPRFDHPVGGDHPSEPDITRPDGADQAVPGPAVPGPTAPAPA